MLCLAVNGSMNGSSVKTEPAAHPCSLVSPLQS